MNKNFVMLLLGWSFLVVAPAMILLGWYSSTHHFRPGTFGISVILFAFVFAAVPYLARWFFPKWLT